MTASDIAAWWGAGLATLVLAWDVVKWRSTGSRVTVSATPNMSTLEGDRLSDKKSVVVEVVNTGGKLVTLTHLVVLQYKTRAHAFLGKRKEELGIIPDPGTAQRLPYELAPGQRWVGLIDQQDIASKLPSGLTYCGILHSGKKMPVLAKLNLGSSNNSFKPKPLRGSA